MSTPGGNYPQGGVPQKKKTSPLVWILVSIAGLIVVLGLLMVAGELFIFNKARQAGFDPELMRENPGLAIAQMAGALDEDVDVVRVDEDKGLFTLRDKKSGKTVTVDFEKVKEGKITFESDEGETVTLEASGEAERGSMRMEIPEGTFQLGEAASGKTPDWVPMYPGSTPEAVMSGQTGEGYGGTVTFTTSDSVEQVMKFYTGQLEQAGFEVNTIQRGGASTGGMVSGESAGDNRNVMVMIGTGEAGTTATISYPEEN